jgi:hypothetical protein
MVTRLLLIQPKPDVPAERVLALLHSLHRLRQEWPGILDIATGATRSPDYPFAAVLRFVQPSFSILVVDTPEYQQVVGELHAHCTTVLSLDLQQEDHGSSADTSAPASPAYGFFAPTVEEQLRQLVYLWFTGTGQPLTKETIMADLFLIDDFGLGLAEFERAVEQQFGVQGIVGALWPEKATFGDLLSGVEIELTKLKASRPLREKKHRD